MSAANELPAVMTVAEFLAWNLPGDLERWELIDGSPRAMAPSSPRHGLIQNETARLIGNHIAGHPSCRIATEPWPHNPMTLVPGESINFTAPLAAFYRTA